jgi:HSP20 family molecular chaperone IbpA
MAIIENSFFNLVINYAMLFAFNPSLAVITYKIMLSPTVISLVVKVDFASAIGTFQKSREKVTRLVGTPSCFLPAFQLFLNVVKQSRLNDRRNVDRLGITLQQEPAGRVSKHRHRRVADREFQEHLRPGGHTRFGRPAGQCLVPDAVEQGAVVEETREPMVDVFDEGDHLLLVAELPGVEAKDIHYEIEDDVLSLSAVRGERKYRKEVLLPAPVRVKGA